MRVYALIILYNPKKWISKCLVSLRDSTIQVKTIVVDNGSTDGSQKVIKESYPEVDFIQSDENLGFGRANNIGIKKAYDEGADYIFLLNQDAWVEKDTIEKLVQVAELNKEYGIVSPMHLNGNGTALDYKFSGYVSPENCTDLFSDAYLGKLKDTIYETSYVNAACWLLSRKCIEIVGGFNPLFFLYGEDDEYINRVKYHGLKIGIYPLTRIFHDRENRKNNGYDEISDFKKKLIIDYCDPRTNRNVEKLKKDMVKNMIKSIILFRKKTVKNKIEKYKIIKKSSDDIKQVKETVRKKGLSFL